MVRKLAVNEQEQLLAGGGGGGGADSVDDAWIQKLENKVKHPSGPAGDAKHYLRVKNRNEKYSAVRCNEVEKMPNGSWQITVGGGGIPFIQNGQWIRTLDAPRRGGLGRFQNDYFSPIAFQGRLVFLNTKNLEGSGAWKAGKSPEERQAFATEQHRKWKEAYNLHEKWIKNLHSGIQFPSAPNGKQYHNGLNRFREVITNDVVNRALSPEGLPDGSADELSYQRLTDTYLGYVAGQNIEHVDALMLAEYRTGKTSLNIDPRVVKIKDDQNGELRDLEAFREVPDQHDAILQGQGLYQIGFRSTTSGATTTVHMRAELLGLAVSSVNGELGGDGYDVGKDAQVANKLIQEDALWSEHFGFRDPLPALGGSHKNRADRGLWEESPGMQAAVKKGLVTSTEAKWITSFGRGSRDETYGRNGNLEDSVRFLQALDAEDQELRLQQQGKAGQGGATGTPTGATPLGDLVKADGNAFGAWGMLVFGHRKDEKDFDPAAFARNAAPKKELVSHDAKAPLVDVRHMNEDMQKFFGVRLMRDGDATPIIRPSSKFGAVVAMHFDPDGLYPKKFSFKGYRDGEPGSKGVFLESHPFPHVVTAKDEKAVLRYCLAKYGTDGKLYMIEVVVPFGYGLFVNKNVIHGDTYVKGTVLIYLEPLEEYADSALVRTADGKMVNYYKESDVLDFPYQHGPDFVAQAQGAEDGSCGGNLVCNGASTAGLTIAVVLGCGLVVAVVMFFLMGRMGRARGGGNDRTAATSARDNVDADLA
ncbi:unnamed protein product [Amoebophrya sp. A120]|nr:unnamed protein product [Amoebophrya sp. A120]|eukprot:GSA120T00010878001.1